MKKQSNSIGIINSSPRTFTFNQLSKISDDNYGILNRCIDMSLFNSDDLFLLNPIMVHHHAFGKEVHPHLRTRVTKINDTELLAYQDVSFDQWEQGVELNRLAS